MSSAWRVKLHSNIVMKLLLAFLLLYTTASAQYNAERIAIFPYDTSMHWLGTGNRAATVNDVVLNQVEETVRSAMTAEYKLTGKKLDKMIATYNRQYIAFYNAENELRIWVNLFCPTGFYKDWKTKIVNGDLVDDGGDCYIRLIVLPDKKKYTDFRHNGYG